MSELPIDTMNIGRTDEVCGQGMLEPVTEHPRDREGVFVSDEGVVTRRIKAAGYIAGACVPYTLEIPEEITDPRVGVIINGYGGKKFGYDSLGSQVAQGGKPFARINPPRTQKHGAMFLPRHLFHPERLQAQAAWSVMRDIRETHGSDPNLDLDQFDLAGHSMGGFIASELAEHKPDEVANIVFIESAGFEDHNLAVMAKRVPDFLRKEMVPAFLHGEVQLEKGKAHALRSELDYVAHNLIRTMLEGYAVANCDNRETVARLRETTDIGMYAVLGNNDALIPANKTIEASSDLFDSITVLDGGHLLPITQPAVVADAIHSSLHPTEPEAQLAA